MKISALIHRRLPWINLPGAILMMLLQRAPVLNVAAAADELVASSPVGVVLKAVLAAVAALGAVNSMAGATPLGVTSGTSTGVTVAAGTAVSVSYSVAGAANTANPPMSWTVTGSIPPGCNFSGLTSAGTVNVEFLALGGTPTTAGTYMVTLQTFSGLDGTGMFVSAMYSYTVTVTGSTNTAPAITTQPSSQTVTAGASASFTAAASGTPTPTLQWQRAPSGSGTFTNLSEGGSYTGTTTGTLTVSGTAVAMSGDQFQCVATNSVSSATSNAATLTVNAATSAPAFTLQPANQTVTAGTGATFTVTASGNPAPTLQWQRQPSGGSAYVNLSEGGNYTGTTTGTLSVSGTVTAMSGDQFQCIATNGSGSSTSNAATLTVNPVPVINSISYNSTTFPSAAPPGKTVSFTYNVTNTGTNTWGPNHYLVLRDASNTNLAFASINGVGPGASTTATLSFTAPATPGHYTYYVQGLENNVAYFATRATLSLLVGAVVGDFNGDGHPDILWENTAGVDRAIWFMNGTGIASFAYLAGVPNQWHIVGTADFNGDGQTDILWENTTTGDRSIWLMNGTSILNFAYLAYVDPVWHIAALGDFNGNGQTDVLWENTAGVDRAIWYLNGTNIASFGYLAGIPNEWKIVGAADFNGDGHTDIVWENTLTGDRSIWLMNGTTILSFVDLGVVAPAWHIAMVADFDGDGQPDLLWENRTTGDRVFWLMNGTTHASSVYLAYVNPVWHIAP